MSGDRKKTKFLDVCSVTLQGEKKKDKLRGLRFSLKLQEVSLLQNGVLPRPLACQTVLFTHKSTSGERDTREK